TSRTRMMLLEIAGAASIVRIGVRSDSARTPRPNGRKDVARREPRRDLHHPPEFARRTCGARRNRRVGPRAFPLTRYGRLVLARKRIFDHEGAPAIKRPSRPDVGRPTRRNFSKG